MAQSRDFDVYILDVVLPDGTGIELCEKLREFHPNTPMLFYSVVAQEVMKQRALERCGDMYLVKPATLPELEEVITRLLDPQ